MRSFSRLPLPGFALAMALLSAACHKPDSAPAAPSAQAVSVVQVRTQSMQSSVSAAGPVMGW